MLQLLFVFLFSNIIMKKPCKGTVYVVSGKKWCVGEKKISKQSSKKNNKSKKNK